MSLESLIQELQAAYVLKSPRIVDAFRRVDRRFFVSAPTRTVAYVNAPLPIGQGQTISQPLTVVMMLELLQPQERDHVLDVGAGSGWVTALLAELVGPRGQVTAVERIPALAAQAKKNLSHFSFPQASLLVGDASHGWRANAPYDCIHVAAAALTIPDEMKAQLAMNGRLIIPVGEPVQDLALITKTGDNTYSEQNIPGFQFVPLVNK